MNAPGDLEHIECIFCSRAFDVKKVRPRIRTDCHYCRRNFAPTDCAMLDAAIAAYAAAEAAKPKWRPGNFYVRVLDMFHYMDEEEEIEVDGFATRELAREYARRRTRDSLEEQRSPGCSAEELRSLWYSFGEDCVVVGDGYCGAHELDFFIANPATVEERDWMSLTPDPAIRRRLCLRWLDEDTQENPLTETGGLRRGLI
jgi:hypothetical protein